jgi:hypothetical protein
MTTNLLRGKMSGPRPDGKNASKDGAIGELDAHVFNCPACARPLSEGTSRCPACGTRLVMGVMVKRAGAILGLGLVTGMLFGGGVTAAAITLSLHDRPAVVPQPTVAAIVPTVAPSVAALEPVAPPAAIAALSGTAVVNGRIAVDATSLSETLSKPNATTIELARDLRSLAADAALGSDLVGRLAPWRDADAATNQLDAFYGSMASTARQALRASLTDNGSYRQAAIAMIAVLGGLDDVDTVSRTLAATVALDLPPVVMPDLGRAGSGATSAP